ncbi:MAG TPA: glycosyltransferase family A protein, partial [Fimbriimonas sp.]|nr:glycosyltransferase family A protein [Fimbriimonas sp.]
KLPLVSILTPSYNHEAVLGECIRSVLEQTFSDWEQIVVNDGSTDGTAKVAQSFDDPRVRYFEQANKGPYKLAETYNFALSQARGELICILEGDDLWPANKLEIQLTDFEDGRTMLSAGMFQPFRGEEKEGLQPSTLPAPDVQSNLPTGRAAFGMLDPDILTFTFPVSVVIRRTALEQIGGFQSSPLLPLVDYPTFLSLTTTGPWKFRDDLLGYWRKHSNSITTNNFPKILEGVYAYAAQFMKEHRAELPLTDDEVRQLDSKWQFFQMRRATTLHRMLLAEGDFRRASAFAKRAMRFRISGKARAGLSLARVLAGARLPSEGVFRLAGFPDWKGAPSAMVSCEMTPEDLASYDFTS